MRLKETILNILTNDVKLAVGCTEPVAIALGVAAAANKLNEEIEYVEVNLSPNIYKNGMFVGIPNIDEVGLDVAASLGAAIKDPSKKLTILSELNESSVNYAKELLRANKVKINLFKDSPKRIYVESIVKTKNNVAKSIIEDQHDNITSIKLNNKEVILEKNQANNTSSRIIDEEIFSLPIKNIIEEIEKFELDEIKFMLDGLDINMKAAELGLKNKLGIGVGYAMKEKLDEGIISKDLPNLALVLTAAASDARMSGLPIPVMSSNGSGNHGITAILPIAAYSQMNEVSDEKLAKALAISHIITAYIKNYIGRLSSLCGCSIAAATGSSCAIGWLMDGNTDAIQGTIKNILANQTGVVCDGAKAGCALKLATAASSGVQSAMLAKGGYTVDKDNGIVTNSAEESIKNLGSLSKFGMDKVDNAIIDIMLSSKECC